MTYAVIFENRNINLYKNSNMKHTIISIILASVFVVFPNTYLLYSQDVGRLSYDCNYILTIKPLNASTTLGNDEPYAIQYFDGLGRPNQTVLYKTSPDTSKSIISLIEYYNLNSVEKQWLPASLSNGTLMGKYRDPSAVKTESQNMYGGDSNPYTLAVYDNSALNRVARQYGPGEVWHNPTIDKFVGTDWLANTTTGVLSCNRYEVTTTGNLSKNDVYPVGKLYVTKITDEDGNVSYEFKNLTGQVLLSRSINAGLQNDTYYVYDFKGNLRYVLSPMASATLVSDDIWGLSNETIMDFCYQYKYDGRNRVIEKKLPGCDPIRYVYDINDRVLFSQDGVQAAKDSLLWTFNLYDGLGRPVITGECVISGARSRSDVKVYCTFDLTANHYNTGYNVIWQTGSALINPTILAVNYYDNYQFKVSTLGFTSNLNYTSPQLTGTGYVDTRYNASGDDYKSRGLLTGIVVCQLNNPNNKSYSVFYYDNKDRIVFSNSTNHLSGFDRVYTNYTFTGSPKLVLKEQTISGNSNPVKEKYVYSYDHAGRLTSVDHSYNGNTAVEITKNTYDNIGRLASTRHNSTSTLQTQYTYNVRSWITGITSPGFNQEIVYNKADGSVRTGFFGGNILETKWKHTPSGTLQNYTYTYDNLSRLTSAVSPTGLFNESVSYDMNGNISSLIRHATLGVIDDLVYNYDGNMIIRITDNAPQPRRDSGFVYKAPGNPGDITYTYDRNGSMTGDYHRSVGIEYNLLNLPKKVTNTLDTTKNMTYVYDSQGRKLRQTTRSGGAVSLTEDYIDNMIYKNGTLAKVLIPGGYIDVSGTQTSYHYFALDHLGNVRQVLSSNGQQEEQDDYYPFGLRQNRSSYQLSDNKYKYNGKEQEEFGSMTTLDYGARLYDPAIGRWSVIDPMAEKSSEWSPDVFLKNSVLIRIDYNGKEDFLLKQIKNSKNTTAESTWLVFPTGTLEGADINSLRTMSVADIKKQFGQPTYERMGSSLPDNPSKSDNDKSGNSTINEGAYTYKKGSLSSGLPALLLNEGKGFGKVSTELTNYKNNPKGEKMAIGVAAHAGNKEWQIDVIAGKDTQKIKGSEGCPTTTGFGEIYKKIENSGKFIIVRNQKEYEEKK